MPGRKRRKEDPLEPYRRVRKPVPPPGRVIPDRRREIDEDQAEKDLDDELGAASERRRRDGRGKRGEGP